MVHVKRKIFTSPLQRRLIVSDQLRLYSEWTIPILAVHREGLEPKRLRSKHRTPDRQLENRQNRDKTITEPGRPDALPGHKPGKKPLGNNRVFPPGENVIWLRDQSPSHKRGVLSRFVHRRYRPKGSKRLQLGLTNSVQAKSAPSPRP